MPPWCFVLSVVLPLVGAPAGAGEVPGGEAEYVETVRAALEARGRNTPPLTGYGLWRGFYTQVHWDIIREVTHFPERFDSMVRGDRAAVAVALWESADGEDWDLEYQGVYRGPNSWVYPKWPADPRVVSDLYRLERASRDRFVVLDLCMQDHPCVYATAPPSYRGRSQVAAYLGLADGYYEPFPETLDGCLRDDRWHLAPIQQEGTRVRLSLGWWDEKQQEAGEVLLEVDTAQSFAPVRFRGLSLSANGKGTGHEVQWSKYSDPGEGAPPLAGRMVRWDFNYYGPRERGWLEWTQVFDWLQLACTSPSSRRPSLPRFADFDDSLSSTVLPPEDQGSCFGGAVSHAARGFAGQAAPEPPADLAALDVKAEVARIRGEYGYK